MKDIFREATRQKVFVFNFARSSEKGSMLSFPKVIEKLCLVEQHTVILVTDEDISEHKLSEVQNLFIISERCSKVKGFSLTACTQDSPERW